MDISKSKLNLQLFNHIPLLTTICLILNFILINADRVGDKIYTNVQSDYYCSRRLNATHQMGCQSELGGNTGVIWFVDSQDDINHILKIGPTPPYIAILKRDHFTRKNLLEFKGHYPTRVTGVVYLDINHDDSKLRNISFSPEDRCPNRYSGLYVNDTEYGDCKQNLWNPESPISGLFYDDIPYPIFLIDEKDSINNIQTCFNDYNLVKGDGKKQDTYPLCSMQLDSFMLATINSKTCLNSRSLMDEFFQSNGQRCNEVTRRKNNIFAYYKPAFGPAKHETNGFIPSIVEPQSVILLIAKLSSFSMFSKLSPGADSTISAMVTMLAVAEALGKYRNETEVTKSNRNIAFAFLDSEPFDYTGSSRMVFDMKSNTFPMGFRRNDPGEVMKNTNLESIEYIINLDQMASYPNAETVFVHHDPHNSDNKKLDKILSILKQVAPNEKVNLQQVNDQLPLPPTSVHEFIKNSKNIVSEKKLLGIVLSNYDKIYNNLFYNSIYDDSHNIYRTTKDNLVEHITHVSSFIAKSIYQLAFGVEKTDLKVDNELINELLDCYLDAADCGLFTKAWQAGDRLPKGGITTYKDPTEPSDDMNGAITAYLLAYFIGDRIKEYNITRCYDENNNSSIYNYNYVNGQNEPITDGTSGVCVKSQVLMVPSESPSFAVTETEITVDLNYPAWTVSLNNIRNPARLFIKSSPIHQWCVFLIGIVITCMAFIIVHQVRGSISKLQSESVIQSGTST